MKAKMQLEMRNGSKYYYTAVFGAELETAKDFLAYIKTRGILAVSKDIAVSAEDVIALTVIDRNL